MDGLFEDSDVRRADIQQLVRIAATYANQERFLTELTLDPPDATSDEAGVPLRDEDYLILSTIHSAKGKEWTAVSLLNAVDGCLPSDLATGSEEEIEEERRLLYVALTRAKDELDVLVPQRFYTTGPTGGGDRHVYAGRTRFIPARLLHHFEERSWPQPEVPGFEEWQARILPKRVRASTSRPACGQCGNEPIERRGKQRRRIPHSVHHAARRASAPQWAASIRPYRPRRLSQSGRRLRGRDAGPQRVPDPPSRSHLLRACPRALDDWGRHPRQRPAGR
jgi:hypothetical protein